jgi:cytochrome b subunit of formate dehydrogenase
MALENIVGTECRRCSSCIQACPQVSKTNKDYASGFRRGEKVVHVLLGFTIFLLAITGITTLHYGEALSGFENGLFSIVHKLLGIMLISLPLLYFLIDKHHLYRLFKKISKWDESDNRWIQDLIRHIKDNKKYPLPYVGEFNPGQKIWYLYLMGVVPILSATGLLLMFGLDNTASFGYLMTKFIHLFFALTTDLMLFVHIYLKYLRKWAIVSKDIVKVFIEKRHLNYAELYGKKP